MNLVDLFITKPYHMRMGAGSLAKRFKCTKKEILKAKLEAKEKLHNSETAGLHNIIAEQEEYIKKLVNEEKGECNVDGRTYQRVKTLDDLVKVCEIDTTLWEIVSWECNKWEVGAKNKNEELVIKPLFQVKAKLTKKTEEAQAWSQFAKFLETYEPSPVVAEYITLPSVSKDSAILILPKQDAHFNRYDAKGKNDINDRFSVVECATMDILRKATNEYHLDKITYIVGSDQFNSEWNGLTTGGTPQENILQYPEAFKAICNHEITIIDNLINSADGVELMFVPGNHDLYAGWHMINWLQCYYRNNPKVVVNEAGVDEHRRYERYTNTAIMYEHGANMNGKELAQRFPVEFRKEWGKCDQFYIFSGDKHHEMSLDIQGVKYYRVPALTPTKSKWEHRKGYITRAEMQAFVIKEGEGMSDIYMKLLE